ncbi:MAG TPA: GNAT family N-acetyltransferase [Chitinophaga sp.]|uniref:GNAT family N-acetyltransferase n=1 Tax=Chitinophaga sp. TaxID=1869181 RepID=UPI002BC5F1B7|nr:GNAT family N-acetyltransferase [Chitinophaga sp.]HVI45064.1 GNAT family N-acetyltransferase [Chitinophaga sp.]
MRVIYQSDSIIIREFQPEDQALFSRLFENAGVTRYLPPRTPQEYVELFHKALADYHKSVFSRWGIFRAADDDFIGICVVREFADVPGQVEIGYVLSEAYWGKGVAVETSKALIKYCFEHTDTSEVVAVTDLDNIGSRKVLLKAGFTQLNNLMREEQPLAYFMIRREEV